MAKVLILGSNSFSGASFAAYLMRNGIDVFGTSRSEEPNSVFLPYRWAKAPGSFRFQRIDMNHDLTALEALIRTERIGIIVNFAAQSMVGESWTYPDHWMRTNAVATSLLAERLRHLDFLDRYVHVTTPEVYGSTDGWIAEDHRFNPTTPYAVSRAAGDMTAKIYHDAFKLPVVFTRAANVYGPGQQLYRIIPRTILFALTGRKLQLQGGGVSTRSFIHIDDVSRATWSIARDAPVGETYHISTPRIVSIRDLVEMICVRLGIAFGEAVEMAPDRIGKDQAYWLKSDKLRQALGWRDEITLEDGLTQCIAWIKDNLATLMQQPQNYIHRP